MQVYITDSTGRTIVEPFEAADFDPVFGNSPDHFDKIAPAYLGALDGTDREFVDVHYSGLPEEDGEDGFTERHEPLGRRPDGHPQAGMLVSTSVSIVGSDPVNS